MDEAYVFCKKFNYDNKEKGEFCFTITTRRLLDLKVNDSLHCDVTHKLVWNGFPVTVIARTDKNRRTHLVMIGVSTSEAEEDSYFMLASWKNVDKDLFFSYIMADAAEAMVNAAKRLWPHIKRLMCYAHVYMVKEKKKFTPLFF